MSRRAVTLILFLAAWHGGIAHSAEPGYSAAALYNQGNAYARAGKPGLAVLNYERAALLAPDDPDIAANLQYVQRAAHIAAELRAASNATAPSNAAAPANAAGAPNAATPAKTASSALAKIVTRAVTRASPVVMSWLGLTGLLLLGAVVATRRVSNLYPWTCRGAAALGIALLGWMAGQGAVLWPALHSAVVVTAGAPARVSPVPMGDPVFTLPEAEVVTLTAQHDEFLLVRTAAGRTGWVARSNVAPVIPRP